MGIQKERVTLEESRENYSISVEKEEIREKYLNSQEIDDIVSTISVYETESIVNFGAEVATDISKVSDTVLNSMTMSQIDEAGELLGVLSKIMEKFDIDEIKAEPNFFQKLFLNMKKQIEKILEKYQTLGKEIDKIYIQLKQYENEIQESNDKLNMIFKTNIEYYRELLKYIIAGEQGVKELNEYIEEQKKLAIAGDSSIQLEVSSLEQAKELLEQRVQDLRIAENIAMQSIPMLKTMEFSNLNLIRKINSAFIITLPIFKQALSQAILLKRQKIQAEAISALDKKTNELLIKNAQNSVEQAKITAQLTSGSSIKVESLEETWRIITRGIEETKEIQRKAIEKRDEDKLKLQNMKSQFNSFFNNIDKKY